MKLLYLAIIIGLIQVGLTQNHLESSTNNTGLTAKDKLVEFYTHGLSLISKDFCKKAKVLSNKILNDEKVKKAETPVFRDFKRNITEFLENYDSFMRYNLTNEMVNIFANIAIGYFQLGRGSVKDQHHILELFKKNGYEDLSLEYEEKFEKFIKEQFFKKFEELKQQFPENKVKSNLVKWFKELKNCADYECFFNYFQKFPTLVNTPKEDLFLFIRDQLQDIYIFYSTNAYNLSKSIEKDLEHSELIPELKQELSKSIKNFSKAYETNRDLEQLITITQNFYQNILLKFYFSRNIEESQHEILVEMFDDNGYPHLEELYQSKFINFVDQELFKKIKQFKASLDQKELLKERPLLQFYDQVRDFKDYSKKALMFFDIFKFEK